MFRERIDGKTYLHHAAMYGTVEIFDWLVKKGLYVRALTEDNATCVHFASELCNEPVILRLKEIDREQFSMYDN